MRNRIANLSVGRIVLTSVAAVSLLIFLVLTVVSQRMVRSLDDQQAARRWSPEGGFAQVSCFFAEPVDPTQILFFRNRIETGLQEASYDLSGPARTYVDAYSSQGKLLIASDRAQLETEAVGIGGDFFLFHPLKLLEGGYFSGHDLMKDAVILDEEAAWQLFGSNDVVGMVVRIADIPHYVVGVIAREEGRMWERAGLQSSMVYVSSETLADYGTSEGIRQYETLMPNPVSGFAYRMVKERFGYDELAMEVMDNTDRYSLESLFKIMVDFGLRSMQHYAIRYPYWENYARGFEDILAVLLALQILFLVFPVIVLAIALIQGYRHRTWTWREVGKKCWLFLLYLKDLLAKRRKRKKAAEDIWGEERPKKFPLAKMGRKKEERKLLKIMKKKSK